MWVEYRELIDLMALPLHVDIGLFWYQKSNGQKKSYGLFDHKMACYCLSFNDLCFWVNS